MKNAKVWWRCVAGGLLLWCHGWAVCQEVYLWTDEQGRKHFSDKASTPENKRDQPVDVPPPNIAKPFVPTPTAAPGGGDAVSSAPVPSGPLPENKPQLPDLKKNKFSNAECESLKRAYKASEACFADCSTVTATQYQSQHRQYKWGGRNNANCGHCTQVPQPNC